MSPVLTLLFSLGLFASSQAKAHCEPSEKSLFSCELESGESVFLCGSLDLGSAPGQGTVQFRRCRDGKVVSRFPEGLPKRPTGFLYREPEGFVSVEGTGQSVSFSTGLNHYTLQGEMVIPNPDETETLSASVRIKDLDEKVSERDCKSGAGVDMGPLLRWRERAVGPALGLTAIELKAGMKPVSVFEAAGGTLLGKLAEERSSGGQIIALQILREGAPPLAVESLYGAREVGYESGALEYFDRKEGFVQILPRAGAAGLWVRESDIGPGGVKSWAVYLAGLKDVLWRAPPADLVLRSGPSAASETRPLPAGVLGVQTTGEAKGDWVEVRITGHDGPFICEDGKPTGATATGWIKGSDGSGQPRIWHFTRGC